MVPRAIGGKPREYLEEIDIWVHEPPTSEGPTATAVRTGEVQAVQNIRTDPEYEPWRERALAHGFESSAAVPVATDAESYGVVNLYSARPKAFGAHEQTVLGELGGRNRDRYRGGRRPPGAPRTETAV